MIYIIKGITILKYCGIFYIRLYKRDHKCLHHSHGSHLQNVVKNSRLLIIGADTAFVKTLQKNFHHTFRVRTKDNFPAVIS